MEDTPVQVYCEMGCEEGQPKNEQWTVFQRKMDGSVSFYRSWDHYKKGFGHLNGEYWLGLENLHQLTHKRKYQLRVDIKDFEGASVYALYTSFSVESEANDYKLNVNGFINGGAGDSLVVHKGQKFTTFDKDQDLDPQGNCAKRYLAGFWYNSCHDANPNGIYLSGHNGTYFAVGNVWNTWKGLHEGLKYIAMKIRPVEK